jgi:hypothetical protein
MGVQRAIAALAIALMARGAYAMETPSPAASPICNFSTETRVPRRAITPGAIYQLTTTVHPNNIDSLLSKYARWYLPVDQYVCKNGDVNCESSGRKLLTVLSRQRGDRYNLVFVYRYESAYKEDYYCKFAKAFVQFHASSRTAGFDALHGKVMGRRHKDEQLNVTDMVARLPAQCHQLGDSYNVALDIAQDLVHEADMDLDSAIEAQEGAWYFDVDVCKAAALAETPPRSPREIAAMCPEHKESLLERAIGLKWGLEPWQPKVQNQKP